MKIPLWLFRAVIFGYPLFISALALYRISHGHYETGLYMLTTALLFLMNTRLAAINSALVDITARSAAMLAMLHSGYDEMRAALDAANAHDLEKAEE